MNTPFYQTGLAKDLLQRDVPRMVRALQEIAAELKRLNENMERGKEPPA